MFRRCQRSWYFGKRLACATAKDPLRRKAYLFTKLQSIHAWRGRIVDQVIEKVVVPCLQYKRQITLETALRDAKTRFDSQLDFALNRRIWEPGFKAGAHEDDLAALFCVEYGQPPTQDEIDKAWGEINTALSNLFKSPQFQEIRDNVRAADRIAAQCTIMFKYAGATVRAVPDLICLYRTAPPLIIDWKVHFFGVHDYYQQLVGYAIALTNCGPHKALPNEFRRYPAHGVRLVEAQLLTNEARAHVIAEEDVLAAENRMALEIQQILMAVDGRESNELVAEDFPPTNRLGTCDTCSFRKLCWEN
jgi:hypothetical protein